jgi:hypothetical protein
MKKTNPLSGRSVLAATTLLSALAVSGVASAQPVEQRPAGFAARAAYPVELEPHFTFGPENVYGPAGYGAGLRLSVPLAVGRLGRNVGDNFALTFGADAVHYDNCYFGAYCTANYMLVPVAAQWNLFLGPTVSLFAEGGAYLFKGWFTLCQPGDVGCVAPSDFGVLPTVAFGGRIRLGEAFALTGRLGYPTTTVGVSFM